MATADRYDGGESRVWLAMIALFEPKLPSSEQVLSLLTRTWSDLPAMKPAEARDDQLSFDIRESIATAAVIPAPIPWEDLEGPCATAWYWPEATHAMKRHKAHALVTLLPDRDRIHDALLLTKLVAAIAIEADAAGIYWGEAPVVHSPEVFVAEARNASRDRLPVHLWIGFRGRQEPDGTSTLFTEGMRSFELMEIEIVKSRADGQVLLDRAYGLAHYLIDNGPVVRDGDTIGGSDTERFEVHHTPSIWDDTQLVYRVSI